MGSSILFPLNRYKCPAVSLHSQGCKWQSWAFPLPLTGFPRPFSSKAPSLPLSTCRNCSPASLNPPIYLRYLSFTSAHHHPFRSPVAQVLTLAVCFSLYHKRSANKKTKQHTKQRSTTLLIHLPVPLVKNT